MLCIKESKINSCNTYLKEIQIYDKFLNNISKLETIKETCNLYNHVFKEYNENFYVDGVHLSNKGHELCAKKIKQCIYDK